MTRQRILSRRPVILALLSAILLYAASAAHAGQFITAPSYPVGGADGDPYIGDFNGDGKADLALNTYSTINILLGNGDGTFQHYRQFSATASSLALGDFNSDGKLDIAALGSGVISIFAGQGNGTFVLLGTVTANNPGVIAAGDMNGDGKLDLLSAISSRQVQGVSVLLGNGDGTFQAGIDTLFDRSASLIQVADFNSDGKPDVLALVNLRYGKTTLRILLGNGDGTLQAPIDSLVQDTCYTAAVADFDNDGHLDVAVEGRLTNVAIVDFGTGDGHLRGVRSFATGMSPRAVVTADFNGDGNADLAIANYDDNTVSVLLGIGKGGFQDRADYGGGQSPFALAVGNLNSDGRPDLVAPNSVACCDPSQVSVLLNSGDGTMQSSRIYDTVIHDSFSVATGDLNGDGSPDLVVGNRGTKSVSVLLGNGNGSFGKARVYPTSNPPRAVAIGDFNHDGKPDVVCTSSGYPNPSAVSVLPGNGDGTLLAPIDTAVPHAPEAIAIGDLDGDGNLDVVVGEAWTPPTPGDMAILMGNGDGTFQPAQVYSTGGGGNNPLPVIADVNGDGKPDLLAANGNKLGVLLGKGDGTFRPRMESSAGVPLFALATGDLNGDGNLDVVSAGNSGGAGGAVGIMFGNGDGTFQPMTTYRAARGPHQPSVADFNQDGYLDVAVTNAYGTVSTFLNNGDGTLQAHEEYAVGSYSEQNAVADFNGDGYPDLVVANTGAGFGHSVTVLLNKGAGPRP